MQRKVKKQMTTLEINEVLNYLPHRYPFLLIDRVTDYQSGEWLTGVKNVSINEPFFQGHFPNRPVMPGVLMLESLAQASVVLAHLTANETADASKPLHYFAGIDKARFKRIVKPGDQLDLKVSFIQARHGLWKMHGEARVDGQIACSADLMSVTEERG